MAKMMGHMLVIVLLMITVDEIHSEQVPEEIGALKRRRLYRRHESGISWKSAHDVTLQKMTDSSAMEDLQREQTELQNKIEQIREEQTRIEMKIKKLVQQLQEMEMLQRWRNFFI